MKDTLYMKAKEAKLATLKLYRNITSDTGIQSVSIFLIILYIAVCLYF